MQQFIQKKKQKKDGLSFGIKKSKDKIYDIVVDATEINNEVVRNALKNLEKITKQKYNFISKKTPEDKIIDYANKLIKYGEKSKEKNGNYNFDMAKIFFEKNLVIRSWVGELIYEALTYKDPRTLKSLEKTINIEIKYLLKNLKK